MSWFASVQSGNLNTPSDRQRRRVRGDERWVLVVTVVPSGIRTVTFGDEPVADQVDAIALDAQRVVDGRSSSCCRGASTLRAVRHVRANVSGFALLGVRGGELVQPGRCRTAPGDTLPSAANRPGFHESYCVTVLQNPLPCVDDQLPLVVVQPTDRDEDERRRAARRGRSGCRSRGCNPSRPTG